MFEPSAPPVSSALSQYSASVSGPSAVTSVPTVSFAVAHTINVSVDYTTTTKPEKLSFAAVAAKSKKPATSSVSVAIPSSSASLLPAQSTVFSSSQITSPQPLPNLPETSTASAQTSVVNNDPISPISSIPTQYVFTYV